MGSKRREKREEKRLLRERKGKSQRRKEKIGIMSSPKWIQLTGRWIIPYETPTGRWG